DDQAETLLLNLLRGSGVAGLAGIGARRPLGEALLLRPLLEVPRAEIEQHARAHGLDWCEDPSNVDVAFDRNFLRREILPALCRRWPAAPASLARSAGLLAEAAELAAELAARDLEDLGGDPARLPVAALGRLSGARRRNVRRYPIRRLGLPPPPAARLARIVHELMPAAPDAVPLVHWDGAEVRRYREHVYVLAVVHRVAQPAGELRDDGREVALGPGLGACGSNGRAPASRRPSPKPACASRSAGAANACARTAAATRTPCASSSRKRAWCPGCAPSCRSCTRAIASSRSAMPGSPRTP